MSDETTRLDAVGTEGCKATTETKVSGERPVIDLMAALKKSLAGGAPTPPEGGPATDAERLRAWRQGEPFIGAACQCVPLYAALLAAVEYDEARDSWLDTPEGAWQAMEETEDRYREALSRLLTGEDNG